MTIGSREARERFLRRANPCPRGARRLPRAARRRRRARHPPTRRAARHLFQSHKGAISIKQLSEMSSIKTDDIVSTLQALQLIKYWKGQHMIAVSPRVIQEHLGSDSTRTTLQVDSQGFAPTWQPYSMRAAQQQQQQQAKA